MEFPIPLQTEHIFFLNQLYVLPTGNQWTTVANGEDFLWLEILQQQSEFSSRPEKTFANSSKCVSRKLHEKISFCYNRTSTKQHTLQPDNHQVSISFQ